MTRGPWGETLVSYIDLVTFRDRAGNLYFYARNAQGVHVPIETLTRAACRKAAKVVASWRAT